MKRVSIVLLGVMLILGIVNASANVKWKVPINVQDFHQELDELPKLKTRMKDWFIEVQVEGEVDYLLANWMGFEEEPEEIELNDGIGYISTIGHKYQLGARWNDLQNRFIIENFFRIEDKTDEELREYFDSLIAYRDARVEGHDASKMVIAHLIPEYRVRRTVTTYNSTTGERNTKAEVLESYFVTNVSDCMLQTMIDHLPEDKHEEADDGIITDTYYCISESAFKSLQFLYGVPSTGAPNRAFLGTWGNYALTWGRSGELRSTTKILSRVDLFATGLKAASSYVVWDNTDKDTKMFISDVITYYPAGSEIASINAEYNRGGFLKQYTVTYPDGQRVCYTSKDLGYGY